jgi:hypothetical protein
MNRPLTLTATLALTLLGACGTPTSTRAVGASLARAIQPARRNPSALVNPRGEVRAALIANHELAVTVLWTDRVPAGAWRSTRGPALAAMRASANDRLRADLRVRTLDDGYRIVSIRLDPSETSATAVALSNQKLVPSRPDGRPRGRPLELEERARIELRRIGSSSRFLVWRLTLEQ